MAAEKSQSFFLVASVVICVLWCATGCGSGLASNSSTSGPSYKITIVAPTAGWGTVTSAPSGISCPPTCSAGFTENTQLSLTATPASNYSFNGWSGVCSGSSTCTLTVSAPETATAIFAPAKNRSKVIAYVFTPDSVALKSEEFYLLGNGRLQPLTALAQPTVMTSTSYGLVADVPSSGGVSTSALQAYSIAQNGSLHPQGMPVNVTMLQWVSLVSDSTYVYAATDEGVFGFQDQAGGLTPLSRVQLPVAPPAPCTAQQESANECHATSTLMLSNSSAFLLQGWYGQSGSSFYELNRFSRSQGQLTAEESVAGNAISSGIFAPTPDGNFVYALDTSSNLVVRYAIGGNGAYETNVLSNGGQLFDGFVQFIISPNESFLFGLVSDAAESPRIRVFQIDATSGDLTEVAGSPFLTGEYYLVGGSLDPSGHFLLLVHANCEGSPPCIPPGRIVAMSVNQTTGGLQVMSDVQDGQNPYTVVAAPVSQ
jgi:Divergent InlB B-repeat domain